MMEEGRKFEKDSEIGMSREKKRDRSRKEDRNLVRVQRSSSVKV